MQITRVNALLRVQSFCAKISRFIGHARPARTGRLPPLTDHIARDIGLDPHDRARLSHRWPSQEMRHPFL